MTFESLEDNFMKNIKIPVKTDAQHTVEAKKEQSEGVGEKETYEDRLTKQISTGGLAALFQKTIDETNKTTNEITGQDTPEPTMNTQVENIRYGDQFQDPTNYLTESDIQTYKSGDVYNDSIKEPDLVDGQVEYDQRHSPGNTYEEKIEFEPTIASADDISPQSSISKALNTENPQDTEQMFDAVGEERARKRAFSEKTWSPNEEYSVGPSISDTHIQKNQTEHKTFKETELHEEDISITDSNTSNCVDGVPEGNVESLTDVNSHPESDTLLEQTEHSE